MSTLVDNFTVDNVDTVDMSDVHPKISRKEASRLLKVSIRTVDRYLSAGKLSTLEENGHIWLLKEEIDDFKTVDKFRRVDKNLSTLLSIDTVDKKVDRVDTIDTVDKNLSTVDHDVKIFPNNNKPGRERAIARYKELYDQLREELREKQERLEIANYRVGQLEAQVRNSLPMIEFHQRDALVKAKQEQLISQISQQNDILKGLTAKARALTFSRRILLVIFLILLALQPLWLLGLFSRFE